MYHSTAAWLAPGGGRDRDPPGAGEWRRTIDNFVYNSPTRVEFGRGVENQAGALAKANGASRVLLMYGGGSAERSGLLDRVRTSLGDAGIETVSFGGIVPNPRLTAVRRAVDLGRQEGVDFLLAVGGGSVIDSAKAVGYGLGTGEDVWPFFEKKKEPSASVPVGVVLTLSGSGSETSNSAVITNEEGLLKRGLRHDLSRPRFALLNPELTMTLPWWQTASGCVDVVMHAAERYFTRESPAEVRDSMTLALIRAVIRNARLLKLKPDDYNARAEIMWAGSLAHNDLLGDRHTGDWATHQMEHELSGMFDVAHGAGLAALWGSWARYVFREDLSRFAAFAVGVFDAYTDFTDLETTALAGIQAMEDWFSSLEMPTHVSDLDIGLTDDRIALLADKCTFGGKRTIGAVRPLGRAEIEEIYRMAR